MQARILDTVETAQSFIQATEIWVPDAAGTRLVRSDGLYGLHGAFGSDSSGHSFAMGQGLPGRVWAEGRPIILNDVQDGTFVRADSAERAGLTAAAAVPVYAGNLIKGVLVMLCGDPDFGVGAIEVWHSNNAPGSVMELDGGFYGSAKQFCEVSERTAFKRGQGLPGGVWASKTPMLMRDLGRGYGFVRAESAGAAGLTTGLGIPVPAPGGSSYVLTLLSACATPIARRYELWDVVPGRGGQKAIGALVDGLCDIDGPLWGTERRIQPWQGPVGRAMATGVPVAEVPSGTHRYEGMVALPVHAHGEVTHVVAWFF